MFSTVESIATDDDETLLLPSKPPSSIFIVGADGPKLRKLHERLGFVWIDNSFAAQRNSQNYS